MSERPQPSASRRLISAAPLRTAVAMLVAEVPEASDALVSAGLPASFAELETERITLRQEVDFFEALAEATGDNLIGARLGFRCDPKGSTLSGFVLFASRDLRTALAAATRYAPIERSSADFGVDLSKQGRVSLVLDSTDAYERAMRQSTEFFAAHVLRLLRYAVDAEFPIAAASFVHVRRQGVEEIERLFGAPVRFGAERTALHFSSEELDRHVVTQDDELCRILTSYGEMMLERHRGLRPEFAQLVERKVLEQLPRGGPSAPALAHDLGISVRTLARRLADEGLTLRGLTEDMRRDLAERYLSDRGLRVSQVAYLLGYGEPSAFSAAFRRWHGVSPGRWRIEAGVRTV